MANDDNAQGDARFLEAVGRLGPALLSVFLAFDRIQRALHPPEIARLRDTLRPPARRLDEALGEALNRSYSEDLAGFAEPLIRSARHAAHGTALLLGDPSAAESGEVGAARTHGAEGIEAVLGAFRQHCRAQAAIFPLRRVLPAFDAYFLEPGAEPKRVATGEGADAPERPGVLNASNAPSERGGFSLFLPEGYDEARSWPLVMALHGGWGHGGDFLWTWLREARTRGWLLLAPTSQGTTWSMMGRDHDGPALDSMLDYVEARWNVDAGCRLLTGLSDGGTYALLHGLAERSRFTALAPVAGVLHPGNFSNGTLERATGWRIRWIHGALDWMFPAELARKGASALRDAGAEVEWIEVPDLSHAYPREQNPSILEWASGEGAGSGS